MNKAIVISNNHALSLLYEYNLKAYVDTKAIVKKNLKETLEEISSDIKIVICSLELVKDKNSFEKLSKSLEENNIALITIGQSSFKQSEFGRYDIKSILQKVASILNVTAKDMAIKEVPKFFEVSLKLLDLITIAPCDIYSRNPSEKVDEKYHYFVVANKGEVIKDKLQKSLKEDSEYLYINSDERLRFLNKANSIIVDDLKKKDLSKKERINVTSKGMIVIAQDIFDDPIVLKSISEISRTCINSMHEISQENPKLKNLLENFIAVENEYIFMRTVITNYIAAGIIKNLSWGSIDQAQKLGFALFFHDIYLVDIFRKYPEVLREEELLYREDINPEDKDLVLNHAKLASELVASLPKTPMGSGAIVSQHHGMTSGEGFAVNFKDDISPLAKIMIISEEITIDIIEQFYFKKISKNQILNIQEIQNKLLEKYKNHTYKKIIKTFGTITL